MHPNAAHAAGAVSRPPGHNGQPYSGINVLILWASAMERRFAAPIWMTFKQALELGGHVRKGEKGSPVVYANTIMRTEEGDDGQEADAEIGGYLVGQTKLTVGQVARAALGFETSRLGTAEQRRIAAAMEQRGWHRLPKDWQGKRWWTR